MRNPEKGLKIFQANWGQIEPGAPLRAPGYHPTELVLIKVSII
jgi:hypothetical protein